MTAVCVRHLLLLASGVGLAACDLEAPSARVAGAPAFPSAMPEAVATPATPVPRTAATPARAPAPAVATPNPVATPVWTPTPARPDGVSTAPLDLASPSPGASPSPSSSPSAGPFTATERPLDLAVSGPGFLVLSTRERPAGPEDLLVARGGRLALSREPEGSRTVWRLRLEPPGLLVLGFTRPAAEASGLPVEAAGPSGIPVATRWNDSPAPLEALTLDADRNPTADSLLRTDLAGTLRIAGADPRGTDGLPVRLLLAVAAFDAPEGLAEAPGLAGLFRHAPGAGQARLKVPAAGLSQVLVLSGRLPVP